MVHTLLYMYVYMYNSVYMHVGKCAAVILSLPPLEHKFTNVILTSDNSDDYVFGSLSCESHTHLNTASVFMHLVLLLLKLRLDNWRERASCASVEKCIHYFNIHLSREKNNLLRTVTLYIHSVGVCTYRIYSNSSRGYY